MQDRRMFRSECLVPSVMIRCILNEFGSSFREAFSAEFRTCSSSSKNAISSAICVTFGACSARGTSARAACLRTTTASSCKHQPTKSHSVADLCLAKRGRRAAANPRSSPSSSRMSSSICSSATSGQLLEICLSASKAER